MITIYQTDGSKIQTRGVTATLEWLQQQVGGWIEVVTLKDGSQLVCNEEGKLRGMVLNIVATEALWVPSFGNTDVLVGNIVHLTAPDLLR